MLSASVVLMEDSSECLSDSVNLGRRAALFAEKASSLDSLSIFMSESELSLKILDSVLYLLLNSGSLVSVPFFDAPGPSDIRLRICARRPKTASPDCSPPHLSFMSSPSSAQRALL